MKLRRGMSASSSSAPDRSTVAGTSDRPGMRVGTMASASLACAGQHLIGGELAVLAVDAQAGGGIALRVDVDHQGRLAHRGQGGAQIDGGGGLTDPAFLIGDDQDAGFFGERHDGGPALSRSL